MLMLAIGLLIHIGKNMLIQSEPGLRCTSRANPNSNPKNDTLSSSCLHVADWTSVHLSTAPLERLSLGRIR